jgi:CHAD domain-containing protein
VRVVEAAGPVADVVLDAVAVVDGPRVVRRWRDARIRLLPEAEDGALDRLEKALRAAGAVDGDGRDVLHRALDLPAPAPPDGAEGPASGAEHLAAMLRSQLETLLAHDPVIRHGADSEALHQMRVASRRLRAYLRTARPVLDRDRAEALRDELAWLGGALAPLRDLDVLAAHLRGEAASLEPGERRAVARLLGRVRTERGAARAALLGALESERYVALLDALEEAARQPPVVAEADWTDLAERAFRKLEKAVDALGETPADAELHAVRIRAKRARYAAELAEVMAGKRATRLIQKLHALQDALGEHQDAAVAEAWLRRAAGGTRRAGVALVVGRLVERQRARRAAACAAYETLWPRVERRGKKAWR